MGNFLLRPAVIQASYTMQCLVSYSLIDTNAFHSELFC